MTLRTTILFYFLNTIVATFLSNNYLGNSWGKIAAQEICDNGIDDDTDGFTDLNDTLDCLCSPPLSSVIKNPSFEQMTECPIVYTNLDYLYEFEKATDWYQANLATTADYYNCGYLNKSAQLLGIRAPEGTGMAGIIVEEGWREFIGQCLNNSFLAGKTYTLHLQIASSLMDDIDYEGIDTIPFGPIDIALYGSQSCSNLPFGWSRGGGFNDSPPYPDWKVLGKVNYTPSGFWKTITVNFTPTTNIQAIIIGPDSIIDPSYTQYWSPRRLDPSDPDGVIWHPYFYLDNLILGESNADPFIDITFEGSFCKNSLVLTAHTSIGGGTWQWYKDGIAIVGQKDSVLNVSAINNSGFGTYTARYSYNGKCFTRNYQYELSKFQANYVSAPENSTLCFGTSQSVRLVGMGAVQYTWSNGIQDGNSANIDDYINSSTLFPASLNFIVTGTDANGCVGTDTLKITVLSQPTIFSTDTIYKCFNDLPFVLSGSSLFNPQINDYVVANPPNAIDSSGKFFYPDSARIGINTIDWRLRPDASACWSDKRTFVIVSKTDNSSILGKDTSISAGSRLTLNAADKAVNWIWNTTENTPSITVSPTDTATFCVTITRTTGCQASDCIFVNINCGEVFIPSAFSPNNDGYNDVFYARVRCTQSVDFKIYDRWGNIVFQSVDETTGWDGTYKNAPMNTAIFVYYLEAVLENGKVISEKGNISLVR